jgi:uncharacterized protein involved in exopolysaccharide biosynthesis
MSIFAFFSVLRARAFIIVWSTAVAVCAAMMVANVLPQNYEASAKVQVDNMREDLLTGLSERSPRVAEFLGQQSAIVSNRIVALKVVRKLSEEGYLSIPEYKERWTQETGGDVVAMNDLNRWIADELLKRLSVRQSISESTLTITYRGENPAIAARYANAFADAYMVTVQEQRKRRAARNAASFSEETRMLAKQVEDAREELTEFQQESGIVTIGVQQLESAEVHLATITERVAVARGDYAEAESLYELAKVTPRNMLASLPLTGNSARGVPTPAMAAQNKIAEISSLLDRIEARYGQSHPDYIEGMNELINQQNIVFSAIKERSEYTKRRLNKLIAEEESQKKKVVALQKTKQRFDVLEKNLETNRQTYDLIAARTLEEGLQSRVASVEVLLLSRALPPGEPLIPIYVVILIAGAFLGMGLGSSTAILIELLEGRLRSIQGLRFATRTPVLAEIKMPRPIKKRFSI